MYHNIAKDLLLFNIYLYQPFSICPYQLSIYLSYLSLLISLVCSSVGKHLVTVGHCHKEDTAT